MGQKGKVMTLAEAIKQARTGAGLTQVQLSQLAGVKQATISELENSKGNPEVLTLRKLAAALKCELFIQFIPMEVQP
jgi:transcriptional regulator with XRE-family HTH domain